MMLNDSKPPMRQFENKLLYVKDGVITRAQPMKDAVVEGIESLRSRRWKLSGERLDRLMADADADELWLVSRERRGAR